ncbi:Uncharacterised protein [Starkeya nomas]|uniref:Uncharacterized protein n=1 Tax=Starkeya nomas TaxID=2666134 RepID=A0A5S9NZ21_9HYPH|nr:hypothetical protein [Starkeya nomas]CAA0096124.1 Uncharacterised protein [Starkeya nomas]
MTSRRGFLSLLGATIAAPALVKATTGDLHRIEQMISPDGRLIIRNLQLRQIVIQDCLVQTFDGAPGVIVERCMVVAGDAAALHFPNVPAISLQHKPEGSA